MPDKTTMKDIQEEMSRAFEEFKVRNDKAIEDAEKRRGEVSAENNEKIDRVNDAITEMRKELTDMQKIANRPKLDILEGETDEETEMRRSVFVKYIRKGFEQSFTPEEQRALAGTSDADGQFLVPATFESGIIMKAYNLAELRPICNVAPTGRDTVIFGALSKPTVAWGRASAAVTQQDLTTGGSRMTIHALKALTLIANDTLDDAAADIVMEITNAFGLALAEAEDDAFAAGAGDDNPQGVLNTAVKALYVASGVADGLSDATNNGIDALISCMYTPKKTYRRNGNWALNSTTEAVVRKLKDGEGNYIWQPNSQADAPATLLGKPIVNPEGLPDIAAGAYPIVFGDFGTGYKIRDRAGMSVKRLVERYAEYDQTGFLIKKRVGGQCVLPEAFAPVKIAVS